jgi:hypothetical protein
MAFQWWWRLKPLLPRKKVELGSGAVDLASRREFQALSSKMEAMWYREPVDSYLPLIIELVDLVSRETGIAREKLQAPDAPVTWAEVAQLSRDDLICFESHSVSHTAMSALEEEDLIFEMQHSQQVLQEHTGRPCRHLCYPFGTPASIGTLAPAVARRFYDSAVTMSLGSVEHADLWRLPRVPLYPSNSLFLARLKVVLRCSLLSPSAISSISGAPANWANKWGFRPAPGPSRTIKEPDSRQAAVRQREIGA